MTYIRPSEQQGYCRIWYRNEDSVRNVRRNEREPLLQAIQSGQEWYDAVDLYGDLVHLWLPGIGDIGDASPDAIRRQRAENAEQKQHEITDP